MNNCGVAFGDKFKSGRFAATLILHHSFFIIHYTIYSPVISPPVMKLS